MGAGRLCWEVQTVPKIPAQAGNMFPTACGAGVVEILGEMLVVIRGGGKIPDFVFCILGQP